MSESVSSPCRRLVPADFSASQVDAWVSQAGSGGERAEASDDGERATEWVVAYTNPRREADVERTLRRRRFDAYVPAMTVTRRHGDVSQPLLPRYLFVGMRPGCDLYGLRETPGLEGVVRDADGQPGRVAPAIVAGLVLQQASGVFDFTASRMAREAAAAAQRAREAEEAARLAARARKVEALAPGRKVRIVGGPWRLFGGVVAEVLPPDRARVVITLVGKAFTVPMLLDDIEVVVLAKG